MDGDQNMTPPVAPQARKRSFWWPDVQTLDGANGAIRTAFWVAVFVAVTTTALAIYAIVNGPLPILGIDGSALVDGIVFGVLAVFLFRGSRIAAVLAFALYTVEWIYALSEQQANAGTAMRLLFSIMLLHGVRGAFARRKLQKAATPTTTGVDPPIPSDSG